MGTPSHQLEVKRKLLGTLGRGEGLDFVAHCQSDGGRTEFLKVRICASIERADTATDELHGLGKPDLMSSTTTMMTLSFTVAAGEWFFGCAAIAIESAKSAKEDRRS
jgi:hypothetical protein